MKVLLLKDVYKLGRAGDVKRVADGYGRNYLLPHGLAILATAGAMKQAERIRAEAAEHRAELNKEMGGVAERLEGQVLFFPARASETGKLYGSITQQMVAEQLTQRAGVEINRRTVDMQPVRMLGEHKAHIRLTMDLAPEVTVIVYREGEAVPVPGEPAAEPAEAKAPEPVEAEAAEVEPAEVEPAEAEAAEAEAAEAEATTEEPAEAA